jgi:Rrf2 family protein
MVNLAKHYNKEPTLLKDIAKREDISMKYLDHIITPLRASGLINRKKGGYILSRPPSQISCMEIINILEGSLAPVECVDNPDICERVESCVAIDVWRDLKEAQEKVLNSLTLRDLAERKKSKNKDLKNRH